MNRTSETIKTVFILMMILATNVVIAEASWQPVPYIFARGTDNALWYRMFNQTTNDWEGGWMSAGGIITSDPDTHGYGAPSLGGNHMIAYARGTDNALWRRSWSGFGGPGSWYEWKNIGGILNSASAVTWYASMPSGVSSFTSCTHVFARGADNALWHRIAKGGNWGNWESMGGILSSGPGATNDDNNIYIFARGTDNALWYRTGNKVGKWPCSNESWSDWKSLGGSITDDPDTTMLKYNDGIYRTTVFVRGADNALWYRTLDGYIGWTKLGGVLNSAPGTSHNMVFVRGTDNALWYREWNGASWNSWQSLGGVITSGPGGD